MQKYQTVKVSRCIRRWHSVSVGLVIVCLLIGCSSTRSVGEQVDDAAIVTKIKAKITADTEINPFNIDVDSNEGVVILQGTVAEVKARTKAEMLARETDGVKRVVNLLRVEGGQDSGGGCPKGTCACSDGACREECCNISLRP